MSLSPAFNENKCKLTIDALIVSTFWKVILKIMRISRAVEGTDSEIGNV